MNSYKKRLTARAVNSLKRINEKDLLSEKEPPIIKKKVAIEKGTVKVLKA